MAPVIRRKDLSDPKTIKTVARNLNLQRRQLSAKDRRIVVKAQIVDTPEKSDNEIRVMLGVDHSVVQSVREKAVEEGLATTSATSKDTVGRKYPRKYTKKDKTISVSEIAPTLDPLQTTIDEHIEEASQNVSLPNHESRGLQPKICSTS